jgi:hypothetical protein
VGGVKHQKEKRSMDHFAGLGGVLHRRLLAIVRDDDVCTSLNGAADSMSAMPR